MPFADHQDMVKTFPSNREEAPRCLIRDRDQVYGSPAPTPGACEQCFAVSRGGRTLSRPHKIALCSTEHGAQVAQLEISPRAG
jgi:hypothetical protein